MSINIVYEYLYAYKYWKTRQVAPHLCDYFFTTHAFKLSLSLYLKMYTIHQYQIQKALQVDIFDEIIKNIF